MKNEIEIASITQSAMVLLEAHGYSSSILVKHRDTYHRLQRFCSSKGINEYTETVGQQYIDFVLVCNPSLCGSTLRQYKNSIRRLDCLLLDTEWEPLRHKVHEYSCSCFDNVIREYESYLVKKGKTREHVRNLVRMAAGFLKLMDQFGCTQIASITSEMILLGFNQAASKYNYRLYIGTFFQYAHSRKMTEIDFWSLIPPVVRHHGLPSVYSPQEVEQLLATIERVTELGKRNYAIILIAARLGLRASDIAGLRFDNLKSEAIEIIQSKTKQPLKITLLDEVKEAIFDYVDHGRPQSPTSYIFLNVGGYGIISARNISVLTRRTFMRSGIVCGNRKTGPHSLRASLATALLSEGNDYNTIQRVLGHSNIQSTKSYAKVDIEQLRTYAIDVPPASRNFAALLAGEVGI